ncbi:MAG: hypothetical protein AAFZ63_17955 [Bacteroidota bacterium]
MKPIHIVFPLLLVLFCACNAPTEAPANNIPDAAKAEDAVEQLVRDAFDQVWSGLDTGAVTRLHTEDFLLLEHGEVWTNDTIQNYQLREQPNAAAQGYTRTNDFDFLETVADGKTVWTAYHNYGTWTVGDSVLFELHWLESAVSIYTEDGWKLKMLHSTRVRRD